MLLEVKTSPWMQRYDGLYESRRNDSFPDFPSFLASSRAGCELCAFLRNTLRTELLRPHPGWKAPSFETGTQVDLSVSSIDLHNDAQPWGEEEQMNGWLAVRVGKAVEPEDAWFKFTVDVHSHEPSPLPFQGDCLTKETASLMQTWLRRCESKHETCTSAGPRYTPTRLIDVGTPDTFCKLVTAKDVLGQYTALSYCWGQRPPNAVDHRTLHDNIADRMSGFHETDLPQTLRDAIDVTRKLGLQYIWIDSVAIIQDDTADWQREAAKMESVYANAFVTIAALAADSSHSGFLERSTQRVELGFETSSGDGENAKSGKLYLQYPRTATVPGVKQCKWDERGWTFQEEELSRRVLYFSGQQLAFECGEELVTESGETPRIRLRRLQGDQTSSGAGLNPYKTWYKIGETYSRRLLSFPTDRMPALAGLASRTQSLVDGDDYLAGLWRCDLVTGLMWQPSSPKHMSRAEGAYVAPSWSWMSLQGAVTWNVLAEKDIVWSPALRILGASVQIEGQSLSGQLKAGHLKVSGYMVPLPRLLPEPQHNLIYPTRPFEGYWDNQSARTTAVPDVPVQFEVDNEVQALLVMVKDQKYNKEERDCAGLLIKSSTGSGDHIQGWQRIGHFRLTEKKDGRYGSIFSGVTAVKIDLV
ncbi:hypothetical protein LTR15_009108 [Elasticomyces elasticus]|nr:hypothetical protein LTR15_009108 [Elasticomyces elasticus]